MLVSSCAGYGWTIQRQINIACPLILQFIGDLFFSVQFLPILKLSLIAGFACVAIMNAASTLMIDLVPGQSSSVTACVREVIHELENSKSTDCFSLEQSFTVWSRCRAGVGPRSNHKRYWNWMDLCFNRRFVYLVSTVNIWGYGSWAEMSHKTTTDEGTGIGSGCVIEGLIVR